MPLPSSAFRTFVEETGAVSHPVQGSQSHIRAGGGGATGMREACLGIRRGRQSSSWTPDRGAAVGVPGDDGSLAAAADRFCRSACAYAP